MRYLSVCSGIDAASQAFEPLGWQCGGLSEIEPFPRAVLEQRYGAVPVDDDHRWSEGQNFTPLFGDFTKIEAHHVGPIDILIGGTPCQSFSVAGKRAGLDDPRGNLTLEFLALARRIRARWILWENVPGILSHDGGRTFGTFLGLLGECGFRWSYRVLDAQFVRVGAFPRAVPQRRRRVFVVGYSGAARINPGAILLERESLRGNPAPSRKAGQEIASPLRTRAPGSGGQGADADQVIAHTLAARSGSALCAPDIQTFVAEPDSVQATEITGTLATGGNGRAFPGTSAQDASEGFLVAHSSRAEGFDASEGGSGRGTPIVPIAFSAKDHGGDATEGVSPTLRAGGHTGSHANAGVMPAIAFAQNQRGELRTSDVAPQLTTGGGKPGEGYPAVAADWRVRRLTPRECERLMGFPDDFTKIEWRGKPADQCPDGPRYKALGNSMCVNVMCWLGERIELVQSAIEGNEDER